MDLQSTNVDPSVLNFTQSVGSTHQIEMDYKSNSISVFFPFFSSFLGAQAPLPLANVINLLIHQKVAGQVF